jgi:uncharacterized repeat protein (TIGR01451 family)
MKTSSDIRAAFAGALMLALSAPAFAAGTAADTNVNNTATVDFTVGGVNQPDVTSNTVVFEVDRKIDLTVAELGGAYSDVSPGAQNQALTFTVTNTSNDTLDFRLTFLQDGTGASDPFGGTDDFDTANVEFYLDDGDNVFDAGDTLITFLDEIPADATRTVHVVSDIPFGGADGDSSSGTLRAFAAAAGSGGSLGADHTQTAGADTALTVDTVFADAAGDTGDAARDGAHSDDDAYRIRTAAISVVKTSRVISDPFNGTTNPKRIPGATVEYCIEVTNSSTTTAATAVIVSDDINELTTTFVAGSGLINSSTCTAGDGGAGGAYDGNIVTGDLGTVAASATERFQFRVTID